MYALGGSFLKSIKPLWLYWNLIVEKRLHCGVKTNTRKGMNLLAFNETPSEL